MAHLEGEYFLTYYHSLTQIKEAFGEEFKFIKAEGVCALCPPPASIDFSMKHPYFHQFLKTVDAAMRFSFPFNRWADHIIVTFQYQAS